MPRMHLEVDEVEIGNGRAFTVIGFIDWEYIGNHEGLPTGTEDSVTITDLTETYLNADPRDVPKEEAALLIAEHRARFEEALRDEAQAETERADERRQEG